MTPPHRLKILVLAKAKMKNMPVPLRSLMMMRHMASMTMPSSSSLTSIVTLDTSLLSPAALYDDGDEWRHLFNSYK